MEKNTNLNAKYHGYSSCPLFTGDKKLMLIEFKYDGIPDETFFENQTTPTGYFYYLKKDILPRAYWNFMPKGTWFGRKGLRKPSYV